MEQILGHLVADRYRLTELAGTGGMGRVWRAHDELLDREVAVKEVLAPAALPAMDRTELLHNTVREARAAARLDHPNVIRIFDVVRSIGRSWIVMEYVSGHSLHDVVSRDGPLTHQHAARIGLALLDALDAAHRAGVLHLDVKPHNVLIADDGRVVLTDFGLATIVAGSSGRGEPLLGSPNYIAPERFRDGVASPAADLWSLGATLYSAVEGRPPYARPEIAVSLAARQAEAPDPPQQPGPLHEVIAGLLAADPGRRLSTGAARSAMRDVTRRAVGVHAVPRPRRPTGSAVDYRSAAAPVPARRRRGLLLAGVATAVVAAVGATAAVHTHGDARATPPSAAAVSPLSACGTAAAQRLTDSGVDAPISLPEGWAWHVDTAGFALPVPRGWDRRDTAAGVCFGDPGGTRSFTVRAGGPIDGKPLQQLRDAERTAALPGYQRVSMGLLLITGGGADWEYSWQPDSGRRRHAYRVLLAAGGDRSYTLTWTTQDSEWSLDLPIQRIIVDGFRDSAHPAATWTIPGPGR
ncbi:serine/threonine-protein kinase [Actinoplanes sp. L3-i22]|uniref:serine/threonine-protein kinase n=1 Tax=Actinoplanes sp. L3-i22 TaxID=2836373 RepID=UPI001C861991|nr:serine/threonine-protein kinase [Actinoplanes sp. L3-i22]